MYQKLLLNCEGGIIDATQQSEQDNCAIVCIGLGGTGVDCLKNLKAKIYNRVKPDDPNSAVPVYSHIRFLAVDTDKGGIERANSASSDISKIDLDTEFFDLSYGADIADLFKENAKTLDNKPEYKEWLRHSDIRVLSAKAGAGGVRQLGRYLLLERASDFVAKITSMVSQAMTGLNSPKTYVHIFSGLSGGTGAGTFLDVCYLVQKAIEMEKANSFVCGYFFLPDVNIAAGLDKETKAYVMDNGYASLQELDYCMNFERNGDRWSQNYSGIGTVESQKPPVDICHLVSAKDANGNVIKNAYKYAMNVVTDYFMDFVVRTTNNFTMESHISNYTAKKEKVNKEQGAQYEYCVLGASSATLPFKEVLTYLASHMFGQIATVRKVGPSDQDVEMFVRKNGLAYETIKSQLLKGCSLAFPLPDYGWKQARDNDSLTKDYFIGSCMSAVLGTMESNFAAMTRDLDSYSPSHVNVNASVSSIIAKVYTALRAITVDAQKGPFCASALLRGTTGVDLISIVDGYLATVRNEYNQEYSKDTEVNRQLQFTESEFRDSNILNGGSKYKAYKKAYQKVALHLTRIKIYEKLDELLHRLRHQLSELADNFVDPFKNTINSLIDTFDENSRYLSTVADSASSYEFPLAYISDMKDNLDETIKNMNVNAKITDFLTMMLSDKGIKAWINGNENEIFAVVNQYFTTLFSAYSQKTMSSYLQDKYKTTDPARLIERIRSDIMNKLDDSATPLFWTSSSYNISSASKIGYITYPSVSVEVGEAANQLSNAKANGELKVRESNLHDRISIMRCLVGVPLFGYQGIWQYEINSVMGTSIGKHLYEGKSYLNDRNENTVGRDWRYLPSPTPLSLMNSNNCSILRDEADKAQELYTLAEEKNIIAPIDMNNYGIYVISDAFMSEVRKICSEVAGRSKVEQLEAVERVKAMMQNVQYDPHKTVIPNDATATLPEMNKRLVRVDHFASAPRLQEIVKGELAKLKEIENLETSMEPKEDAVLTTYQNALFAGVIKFAPPVVECEDEFGTKYVLSSPDMLRGGAPLYQALIEFRGLNEDVRSELADAATAVLKTLPLSDDAVNSTRAVWSELSSANMKAMVQEAAEEFPSEVQELKKFLTEFKDNLSRFARKYRIPLE